MLRSAATLFLIALMVSGCGARVSAPSLLPRPVERQPIKAPDEPREAESSVDQSVAAQIATLLAEARTRDAAFQAQREKTSVLVRAAEKASAGSEAWIAAQQAVSALDAARGPLQSLVGQIDDLRQVPANAALGNRSAIDAAAAELDKMVQAETAAIGDLTARLA